MLGESTLKDIVARYIDRAVAKRDDYNIIHLEEVADCLRRSYYNRVEDKVPMKEKIKRLVMSNSKGEVKEYKDDTIALRILARADVVDDSIIYIKQVGTLPDTPDARDIMILNADLWIFGKEEGALIYITDDGENIQFSLQRDKRLFDETKRRATVLHTLLKEGRVPIIEPSGECMTCSYYEKCYVQHKKYENTTLERIFGFKRD